MRAHEGLPSRREGGVCDEQVEEGGGVAWRRGWGRGRVGSRGGGGATARMSARGGKRVASRRHSFF
jgi:hypothetical protein